MSDRKPLSHKPLVVDLTAEEDCFAISDDPVKKQGTKRKRESAPNTPEQKDTENKEKKYLKYWTQLKDEESDIGSTDGELSDDDESYAGDRELLSDLPSEDSEDDWVDDDVDVAREGDDLMVEDRNYRRRYIGFWKKFEKKKKSKGTQTD